MSSLFKTKPGKSTQETTTTKTLPSWLQSAYQDLITQSQAAGNMGMTPEEQQAASFLAGNIGNYQGAFDNSVGSTQSILDKLMAGGPSTADIQAGMNPYLDLVLNRQRQEADKSFYSGLSQLQDQEVNAGAFGGSRSAVAQETLRKNYADNLAKLQEQGLYNAFETSRNQYNQNLTNSLGASVNLANLGGAAQQGVMNTATGLAQAGAMPRNIAQGNSSFLNSIINPAAQTMAGTNQNSTTTVQQPQGSIFSQLVGAGLGIAGMAGGFGALGKGVGNAFSAFSPIGNALGIGNQSYGGLDFLSSGARADNAYAQSGGFGPYRYAHGGMIPEANKFDSGRAVREMPEWLRNDPYLSPLEKEMMWDKEVEMASFYEKHRPAADREYRLENIPMAAPEVDISHEGRMEAAPGVEGDYSDFDPVLETLLPASVATRPMAPLKTAEGKNPFQRRSNENITEAQLAVILARNPSLAGKMQELDNMSEDAWVQLFSAPKGLDPDKSNEEIDALFPGISRKGRTDPVKGFPTGGLTPDKMTAAEEDMYWRAKQPPSLATILSMRQSNGVPKNALNVYLAGSRPEPMSPEFAAEVERNSEALGRSQLLDALSAEQRARDERLVRGVDTVDKNLDNMRAFPDVTGMNRAQRIGAWASALPRQAMGVAGEIALLPAKGGVRLGQLLAQNPDASEAEDIFSDLRAQAEMTTRERDVMDMRNSKMYSEEEMAKAIANQGKAPMKQVGEATSASGKSVPVESAKKPTMSEVEKAVAAQEARPPEEQSEMNVPLIMAGIALMTSKGDPFTSMGEGLAAYLSGKEQIKQDKKEAAKQAKAEALAERAMRVDEGKLGVMRDQIGVDLRRLALDAKKADKETQYTKGELIDDYSNLFKTVLDNEVLAANEKGGVTDMNALLSRAGDRTMERLYHAQGLTPPAQYVKLTPLDQMEANARNKPVR